MHAIFYGSESTYVIPRKESQHTSNESPDFWEHSTEHEDKSLPCTPFFQPLLACHENPDQAHKCLGIKHPAGHSWSKIHGGLIPDL